VACRKEGKRGRKSQKEGKSPLKGLKGSPCFYLIESFYVKNTLFWHRLYPSNILY